MKKSTTKILNKKIVFNKSIGIYQRYTGFTLAEVLITLGIIGVIAAMTIPTLVANYQQQVYVTELKKVYTELNQVFINYAAAEGCPGDLACTGMFDGASQEANIVNTLASYIKYSKNCGRSGTGPNDCITTYKYLDNSSSAGMWGGQALTESGYSFVINDYFATNCATSNGNGPLSSNCAEIFVDVNGKQKPNMLGRDWFAFFITKTGVLYPQGSILSAPGGSNWNTATQSSNCRTDVASYGRGCAGRIMENSWMLDY